MFLNMKNVMLLNLIEISPAAYPLLVKHLLRYPLVHSPDQWIVYRDLRRRAYRKFPECLGVWRSAIAGTGCAGTRHRCLRRLRAIRLVPYAEVRPRKDPITDRRSRARGGVPDQGGSAGAACRFARRRC